MTASAPTPRPDLADNQPRWVVEVTQKPGNPDPAGAALVQQIAALGISGVTEARVNALYELRGKLSASQAADAARQLLADPVTQDFRVDRSGASIPTGPHWRLEVWLKSAVTDPVGESVRKAVKDLGLPEPTAARAGTAVLVFGRLQKAQADKVLEKLLANPIIHKTTAEQR
jgi:phosphoribosylformylglycinamidine (FGAM) synthase PurS component